MRLTLLIMGLLPACVFAANCVRPGDSVFASSFDIPAQRAFYVASNGSNGADGSLATPWRTIQHGIDVAQAGDLVCVRGGIYNELVSMTRSGSLAAGPIVLQSVPGETAIIDGTGLPIRVHGAFVSDEEVHRVVSYLKSQGDPDYIEGVLEGGTVDGDSDLTADGGDGGEKDPMYDQAVEVVLKDRKASISYVQRKLRIGYNRSARLLEDMEKAGLVSGLTTSGQREVLVPARSE